MQKALVSFSLTLTLKVKVFFILLRRWINSNLFELTHLDKNMKRNKRCNALVLENLWHIASKLSPSFSLCLFYEPWSRYIANQSGSAKGTVSPKIGKNIEMFVCFICVGTHDRILIDIAIICYYLFFIFTWQVKIHHTYNTKDIE